MIIKRTVHDEPKKPEFQLGDFVSSIATPIAAVLGMDCVDKETKRLKPGSPCDDRRKALNNLTK